MALLFMVLATLPAGDVQPWHYVITNRLTNPLPHCGEFDANVSQIRIRPISPDCPGWYMDFVITYETGHGRCWIDARDLSDQCAMIYAAQHGYKWEDQHP